MGVGVLGDGKGEGKVVYIHVQDYTYSDWSGNDELELFDVMIFDRWGASEQILISSMR